MAVGDWPFRPMIVRKSRVVHRQLKWAAFCNIIAEKGASVLAHPHPDIGLEMAHKIGNPSSPIGAGKGPPLEWRWVGNDSPLSSGNRGTFVRN